MEYKLKLLHYKTLVMNILLINTITFFVVALHSYVATTEENDLPAIIEYTRDCLIQKLPKYNDQSWKSIKIAEKYFELQNFKLNYLLKFNVIPIEGSDNEARLIWPLLYFNGDYFINVPGFMHGNGSFYFNLVDASFVVNMSSLEDVSISNLQIGGTKLKVSDLHIKNIDVSEYVHLFVDYYYDEIIEFIEYILDEVFPFSEKLTILECIEHII